MLITHSTPKIHRSLTKTLSKHKRKSAIGASVISLLALAVFAFSGLERQTVNTQTASAALGEVGNIKVTVTREGDSAPVTDGLFSFWCNTGEQITGLADDGGRDLNRTQVGVFEITPTEQEKTDATCTQGSTLSVRYDSSVGIYVLFVQTTTYQTTSLNTLNILVQFPLSVDAKDEFGSAAVPTTITFNGANPTITSGSASYWAVPAAAAVLAIQKTGYVSALTTNTGLSSVSVNTSAQTLIQLGNYTARSSAIAAGSTATIKGLQPTIKAAILNPEDTPHNIDELVTFQKSVNNGASWAAFTPLEISDGDYIAYDAADPQYAQTKYRILIANGPEVVLGPIAPSASTQQTLTFRIPFTRGIANRPSVLVLPEVVVTPPPSIEEPLLRPVEKPKIPSDPAEPPPPWKPTPPTPTVVSSTSIQWNLPLDIPGKLLPANANLSKVEEEGKSKKLTLLKSKVITRFGVTDLFILEEGLEPGKLYNDRVLTIDGVEGNFLFPVASTLPTTIAENKPLVLPKPSDQPKTILMAIKEVNTGLYLQADGTFDKIAEWRPWYQWGFAQKLPDGSFDQTKRVLYIAQDIPEGNYKLEQLTKTTEDGPVQTNTLIEIHYVPPTKPKPPKP